MAFSVTCPSYMLDKPILQALTSTGVEDPVHEPGLLVTATDGRIFQYGCFDSSSVAAVAGAPAVTARTTADNTVVFTADVSDGALHGIGCFLSVLTDTYYGWIQRAGFVKDVPITDGANGDVSAGDAIGATTDSLWTKVTVGGTTSTSGIAPENSSSGVGNIFLSGCL